MVSICSTTYNVAPYIGEAIESWLAQDTTFDTEIIISDDGSTDNTEEIVKQYQQRYPEKIRFINTGHIGKMPNFIRSMQMCNGKYVALCDGDDYWIDPLKLQKQYDFMESHPDFSACFTNSYVISEETGEKKNAKTQLWDEATTEGLLAHRDDDNIQMSPGHTSTYFYRNGLVCTYPEWMYGDVMTDFPTYLLLSKYGKAKFINDFTSVYRHRANGVSSKGYNFEKGIRRRIFVYENVNRDFNYKYKKIINPIISDYYFRLGKFLYKSKGLFKAIPDLTAAIKYSPSLPIRFICSKIK